MSKSKKLTITAFILMILTSVFGVTNIGTGFFRMGYAAMPMFIIGGVLFFIPYIFMMIEFGTGFKNSNGGIYVWMEKSVNRKYAFIGIMMWYSSYVIWMFGKALSMWVPLSFMGFGKDVTVDPIMFKNMNIEPFLLGVLGVIFVFVIAQLVKKGTSKFTKVSAIGGIAVILLNLFLILGGIIVLALNNFHFSEPVTMNSLVNSPNPDYQSLLPYLGFLVFAVFAYGGTEAMAGISDQLENPKRDLKKGILTAGIFIIICYIIGFLMVGAIMKWADLGANVTSISALYIIMQNLGNSLGGEVLGQIFLRFAGLGMFLTYLGAFIALSFAPLSQLIGGTQKEFWPQSFQKKNKNGIVLAALKLQTIIVIVFIAVKSIFSLINPEGAQALFELIISMTNVGMTIPYIFLVFAWYKYRKNKKIEKGVIIFKKDSTVKIITIITLIVIAFGNVFTIIEPFIRKNYSTGIWTIIGPIIFTILALIIYKRAKGKFVE